MNPKLPWMIIGVSLVTRFALAWGTEIYPDEAYYWTWSLHPQLSYFDHPGLISWAISLLGLRPGAILFGVATLPGVFQLARKLGGDRDVALTATALFASTPAANLLGTIATPDAPLLCLWVWSLVALASEHIVLTGVLWGLAMLSKYNGILLGAPVLMVLWRKPLRVLAVGLIALAVTSPTLIWNAQNDWEGFRFQLNHGLGGGGGWNTVLEFVGGQLGMAGPVLFGLMVAWLVKGPRKSPLELALAVPVLFFGYASFKARGEANWSAAAWLAGSVGVAFLPWARWKVAAMVVNAVVLIAGAAILLFPPQAAWRNQAIQKLHGWHALSQAKALELPVFTARYQLSSLVTFHTGLPATTWEGRRSQYDLWPRFQVAEGTDALWIGEWDLPPASLTDRFEQVQPLEWPADDRQRALHDFKVFRLVKARSAF